MIIAKLDAEPLFYNTTARKRSRNSPKKIFVDQLHNPIEPNCTWLHQLDHRLDLHSSEELSIKAYQVLFILMFGVHWGLSFGLWMIIWFWFLTCIRGLIKRQELFVLIINASYLLYGYVYFIPDPPLMCLAYICTRVCLHTCLYSSYIDLNIKK